MKTIKLLSVLSLIVVLFTSCSDNADLTYKFSCSEDLIDYATPIITYEDQKGTHEIKMTSEFINSNPTIQKTGNLYSMEINIHYDQVGFDNKCSVKFERKKERTIEHDRTYIAKYNLKLTKGEANDGSKEYIYKPTIIDLDISSPLSYSEFDKRLQEICSREEYLIVRVNKNAKIEVIAENQYENNVNPSPLQPTDGRKVELAYNLICSSDLLEFVTPTLTYTDYSGTHEAVLTDNDWTINVSAICSKLNEDGTQSISIQNVDTNGNVTAPWVVKSIIKNCQHEKVVLLDERAKENVCSVKFEMKKNATIIPDKVYNLSYQFGCTRGSVNIVSKESIFMRNYNFNSININTNDIESWKGDEVLEYVNNVCANPVHVCMTISENGVIVQKNNEQ